MSARVDIKQKKAEIPDVEPIELVYVPILSTSTFLPESFRSVLRMNSAEHGTIYPEQYRVISEKSTRGNKLAQCGMRLVQNAIAKFSESGINYDWISFYVPSKMLVGSNVAWQLSKLFEETGFNAYAKLCVEVSSDVLFEDVTVVKQKLSELHGLGVKTMLSGFGNSFCPTMRLTGLPFNMILLEETLITNALAGDVSMLRSVLELTHGQGIRTAACGATSEALLHAAMRLSCDSYTDGSLLSEYEAINKYSVSV